MTRPSVRSVWRIVAWTVTLALVTAGLLAVRARLDKAHIALVLLLVVLFGSAVGGRIVGIWLAATSFLAFNWFFLLPYSTFAISDPFDWLVLVVFLLTGIVAAQLLYRAQEETRVARMRADEVDRLASVGAEALNATRAEEALEAIAAVVRDATGCEQCGIYTLPENGSLVPVASVRSPPTRAAPASGPGERIAPHSSLAEWVAGGGSAAFRQRDGTSRLGTPWPSPEVIRSFDASETIELLLPLRVRERTVGVLRIADTRGLQLDPLRWRFLEAMSYYAALGVERARLSAEADRAGALREADRLKDALLASVSHDLRTPLTTIKALAHDLRELGDERAEIIEHEADRLNAFVSDLLDLSRLSGGALWMRPELNSVDDLLSALVQRVEPTLAGRPLTVRIEPGDALLFGRFDLVHSLRALTNLVVNAATHAPDTGPIEVSAAREDDEIVIRVSDRGPGLAPSDVARIFEPFQVGGGRTPDARGVGLGLAIARELAVAQGGRVTYTPRPGGGSIFALMLPAETIAEDQAIPDDPEPIA